MQKSRNCDYLVWHNKEILFISKVQDFFNVFFTLDLTCKDKTGMMEESWQNLNFLNKKKIKKKNKHDQT